MKDSNILKICLVLLIFTSISCSVQNNLYLNNPAPLDKGESEGFFAISTGIQPKVDSSDAQGLIVYNNKFRLAPNLHIGGRFRLADKFTLGAQAHFPYIVGGFGLDVRPQYSFFGKSFNFNIAIAGQAGFVVSKDSISMNSTTRQGVPQTVTSLANADIALPIGFKISKNTSLILTPRLSAFSFKLRDDPFENQPRTKYKFNEKVLTLGLRSKKWQIETSAIFIGKKVIPSFGASLVFLKN